MPTFLCYSLYLNVSMGGSSSHYSVIEHITGAAKAKQTIHKLLMPTAGMVALSGSAVFIYALLTGLSSERLANLGLGLVATAIPVAALLQQIALRLVFTKRGLRITKFYIGRREHKTASIDFADPDNLLLSTAAWQIAWDPVLDQAQILQTSSSHAVEMPTGLVAYSVTVDDHKPVHTYIYGDIESVIMQANDIWDFGHVRTLAEADRERLRTAAKTFMKHSGIPVCLAYAPKSDSSNLTVIGIANVEVTPGLHHIFAISPAHSLRRGAYITSTLLFSLLVFAIFNLLAAAVFSVPIALGFWQLVALAGLLPTVPLITMLWDPATDLRAKQPALRYINKLALLIASLGFASFLTHLAVVGTMYTSTIRPSTLRAASATTVLSIGLCMLLHLVLSRTDGVVVSRYHVANPLFWLGLLGAAILLLTVVVASGPLTGFGLLISACAGLLYIAVRVITAYANKHHTREHILELLNQKI